MPHAGNLDDAAERIDGLLARLATLSDQRAQEWAESLVRAVTDLYGEGLARVLDSACDPASPRGPSFLEHVATDELVAGLLLLHGLHPDGLRQRVQEALSHLSPLLGVDDARVVDADEERGWVKVRLLLAAGRGAHRESVEGIVRDVVQRAAPDVVALDVDCPDTGAPVVFRPLAGGTAGGQVPVAASGP